MIDPLLSLAFSMQANKGVYALLLGSGVSRASQIPTGWEIVLDLVRKVAQIEGEQCEPDPAAWYCDRYGEAPDYSRLLTAIAKTRETRQQLLRSYFEPNEDERDQGLKWPTEAHRAIARLVARGFVRVIITTNFDRLVERAIEDEGITPTVISTPNAVEGTLPLVHEQCCVIKVHGDYLDTRIKNSPKELEKYDRRMDKLLDRIFDEFGMIVCGWSGAWNPALRSVFERCKSQRFSHYWAIRGRVGEHAERLIRNRDAVVISINDADHFFCDLGEKVYSLESLGQAHPLTAEVAAATAKRYLSEDRHRIRLHDLIRDESERAFASLQPVFQSLLEHGNESDKCSRALREFEARVKVIRAVCVEGGYWGTPECARDIAFPIHRLAIDSHQGQGDRFLDNTIRSIPSIMLLYASGIAALSSRNFSMLAALLLLPQSAESQTTKPLLTHVDWGNYRSFASCCRIGVHNVLPPVSGYMKAAVSG